MGYDWGPYRYWKTWRLKIGVQYDPEYTFGGDVRNPINPNNQVYDCQPQKYISYNPVGDINGQMYMGSGAGKHLLSDIRAAEHSVKVISPYISAELLNTLFDKRLSGKCDIAIITMQGQATFDDDSAQKDLVLNGLKQNAIIDEVMQRNKTKWIKTNAFFLNLFTVLLVLLLMGSAICFSLHKILYFQILAAIGIVLIVPILYCVSRRKKYQMLRVRSYSYEMQFPFKILLRTSPSLHQKIYIIDDKIAYVGSLNFTLNGCYNNLETSIKIDNEAAVSNISRYFESLMVDRSIPYYSIEQLRKIYFRENYY